MYWGAQSWMHYLIVASSTVRGRITSLLSTLFLMQPRMPLTFCTARSHWHLLFNSVSANASGQFFFFFYKAAFQMVSRKHLLVHELIPPQEFPWGNMCLILLNFIRFLSVQGSSPFIWMAAQLLGISVTPPGFKSCKLAEGACHLILWVINEGVKQHGPQY